MSVRDNRQQLLDNEWSIVPLIPYDVPVNSAGKRPWHNDWVKWADTPPTEADLDAWDRQTRWWDKDARANVPSPTNADQNTGIVITDELVVLDLDFYDKDVANYAKAIALQRFGHTPLIRVGQEPKVALFYRAATPITAAKFHQPSDLGGQLEVLAKGNQVASFGTHPNTKKPYYWIDQSPLDVTPDELPIIEGGDEAIEAFVKEIAEVAKISPNGLGGSALFNRQVEYVKDAKGLIVNNREDFLRAKVYEAACKIAQDTGELVPPSDKIAVLAYDLFCEKADPREFKTVSGELVPTNKIKWDFRQSQIKANALHKKLKHGGITLPIIEGLAPYHDNNRLPVDEARKLTEDYIKGFLDGIVPFTKQRRAYEASKKEHQRWSAAEKRNQGKPLDKRKNIGPEPTVLDEPTPPAPLGFRAHAGLGKTSNAIQMAVAAMMNEKLSIEDGRLQTLLFAMPTHKVNDEKETYAELFIEATKANLSVGHWYGRSWQSPEDPDRLVCDNHELYNTISQNYGDPEKLCKICPFAGDCYALKQKEMQHNIWFVATPQLFSELPKSLRMADAVIIDEDVASYALQGTTSRGSEDDKALIIGDRRLENPKGGWTKLVKNKDTGKKEPQPIMLSYGLELSELINRLRLLLEDLPADSFFPLEKLTTPEEPHHTAFTTDLMMELYKVMLSTKREFDVDEDATVETVRNSTQAKYNKWLFQIARLIKTLAMAIQNDEDGSGLAGQVRIVQKEDDAAGSYKAYEVIGLKELTKNITERMPILRMDATLRPDIERHILPNIEILEPVGAETPHQHVYQVPISAAKASVVIPQNSGINDKERTTRNNRVQDVKRIMEVIASQSPNGALGITFKDFAERLKEDDGPDNVEYTHFKEQRGNDTFGGRDNLLIYGKTEPSVKDVETIYRAFTGKVPTTSPAPDDNGNTYWPKEERGLTTVDNIPKAIRVAVHPDPGCDQILQWVRDDELDQAVGRVRGVNRTAENPVNVFLITQAVLPLPVKRLVGWDDFKPNRLETALARNKGVLALHPDSLATKNKDLWANGEQVRNDIKAQGNNWVKLLYSTLIGEIPINEGQVQKAGARGKASKFVGIGTLPQTAIKSGLSEQVGENAKIVGLEQWPEKEAAPAITEQNTPVERVKELPDYSGYKVDTTQTPPVVLSTEPSTVSLLTTQEVPWPDDHNYSEPPTRPARPTLAVDYGIDVRLTAEEWEVQFAERIDKEWLSLMDTPTAAPLLA